MMFDEWPHVVTVQKLVTSQDGSGGTVEDFSTTRQAAVACLITQESGRTDRRFDSEPRVQSHTVSTAYLGTQPGDRLLVTTGPANLTGKYLTVDGVTTNGPAGDVDEFAVLSCTQVLP